ncbi:MAG: DASH family cryptochrome [Bacteroidota bacterium]
MKKTIIHWFRNDLRLHDNPALLHAIESGYALVPVFIVDNMWYNTQTSLGFPRADVFRKQFLAETLLDLKKELEKLGSTLYIFNGHTPDILLALNQALKPVAITAQREYTWEELNQENQIAQNAPLKGIWGSMLFPPDQVDFPTERSPFYFTKFKNKVTALPFSPQAVATPQSIPEHNPADIPGDLPFFDPAKWTGISDTLAFKGGETRGLKAFNDYMTSNRPLQYNQTRDHLAWEKAGSGLSPWLANGSLSPRLLHAELANLQKRHPDQAGEIQPFLEQLIWRDYFRFLFLRYGSGLFTTKGLRKTTPQMYNDREAFEQWREGRTGEPIIDALMRQLKETGYISNRGRMLVSFYLAKEMKVNWQWGAAWFESVLVDYDVCSNYGNWGYQSGRGTDSRVNRRFNLKKQAEKFDPDGELRKTVNSKQ